MENEAGANNLYQCICSLKKKKKNPLTKLEIKGGFFSDRLFLNFPDTFLFLVTPVFLDVW